MSFHLYADDSQIYVPLKRQDGFCATELLKCIDEIKIWMSENFLHFNGKKTEVLVVGPSNVCDAGSVNLGSLSQFIKPTVCNLGVKMDQDLKLDKQISAVVKASFFHLRQLAKIKSSLSRHHFEILIHAFVTTRLDYCNALYSGISQSSLARLQLVQNAAARLLTGSRKYDHVSPLLSSLHWLPVRYRIDFKILLFVFKCLNGLAPRYLSDLLVTYSPSRSLRSTDQHLLVVPKTKRKLRGDRAFSVLGPRLWNELPLYIRQAESLLVFKSRLKTHMFSLAFD